MNKLLLDLRYVSRLLAKSPSFAITSLIVIVLGMALYICTYSFTYNFMAKPLSFDKGDRFVAVKILFNNGVSSFGGNFDGYAINTLQQQVQSFSTFGAYSSATPFTLSDGEFPRRIVGASIMPRLLEQTGIQPIMGRLLTEEDALPGAEAVALVSHDIWKNYYAGDIDIVGSTRRINGQIFTVIGVMPPQFDYPFSQQIWLPLDLSQTQAPSGMRFTDAMGVLKEGVTLDEATKEVNNLVQQLVSESPNIYGYIREAIVVPHTSAFSSNSGISGLFQLLNIVILALVILNLGALLFVRAHSRQQELAVRSAIGANPWQVARQILLESFLLCLLGLLLSLVVADVILYFVEAQLELNVSESDYPGSLFSWVNLGIDLNALTVAASAMGIVWVLSGAWVAYRAARTDTNTVLNSGGKGAALQNNNLAARLVVGIEVCASCFLLIVCCLLTLGIVDLYRIDFGTATENYVTGIIELNGAKYNDVQIRQQFLQNIQTELASRTEFQNATITSALPGQSGFDIRYALEDRDLRQNGFYPTQSTVSIAENYLSLLNVNLLEGRHFSETDNRQSQAVGILDELLANQLWPGESAIGKRLLVNPDTTNQWVTIVGVSSHIIQGSPFGSFELRPTLYRPIKQLTLNRFSLAVQVEQGVSPLQAELTLKNSVKALDRDLAIISIRKLDRVIEMSLGNMSLVAKFAASYGIATLIFAVIGIYGLIARSVVLRTNEVGIRKALGSTVEKVLWLFIKQGLVYLVLGISVGCFLAVLASNVLTTYFNNLLDPLTLVLITVTTVMGTLVLLASYLPARRAARMEPGDALRDE